MCRTYGAHFLWFQYPGLPAWANSFRASGAEQKQLVIGTWQLAKAAGLTVLLARTQASRPSFRFAQAGLNLYSFMTFFTVRSQYIL